MVVLLQFRPTIVNGTIVKASKPQLKQNMWPMYYRKLSIMFTYKFGKRHIPFENEINPGTLEAFIVTQQTPLTSARL